MGGLCSKSAGLVRTALSGSGFGCLCCPALACNTESDSSSPDLLRDLPKILSDVVALPQLVKGTLGGPDPTLPLESPPALMALPSQALPPLRTETLPPWGLSHAVLPFPQGEIVQHHGYPYEEHEVLTEDGYYLTLQRIPHGRDNPESFSLLRKAGEQASNMFCPRKYHRKLCLLQAP